MNKNNGSYTYDPTPFPATRIYMASRLLWMHTHTPNDKYGSITQTPLHYHSTGISEDILKTQNIQSHEGTILYQKHTLPVQDQ